MATKKATKKTAPAVEAVDAESARLKLDNDLYMENARRIQEGTGKFYANILAAMNAAGKK